MVSIMSAEFVDMRVEVITVLQCFTRAGTVEELQQVGVILAA